MRRRPGTLLPFELSILASGVDLARKGQVEFHGYAIAKEMRDREAARKLAAQGTLYRALDRLEGLNLLKSRQEDAEIAAAENRPRRRLYRLTALGEKALAATPQGQLEGSRVLRTGQAPA
jgi:DNA-binding PadR family transcriptional regulator